jgi:hypothetical protein
MIAMIAMTGVVLDPLVPLPVVAALGLLLAVLTVRIYLRVGAVLDRARRGVLLAFRLVALALVLGLVLQPSRSQRVTPPTRNRVTLVGLDSSASMKQADLDRTRRFDAARDLLVAAGVQVSGRAPAEAHLRLFEFDADARPLGKSLFDLSPKGPTTRFHKSVGTMLASPSEAEQPSALVLLTDGHDFELVNPAKTGGGARTRQVPIYAVAFGRQGKVRDVSVRIASYQPYCYVKQKARIAVSLRVIGAEFDDLTVQLLRQGQPVQSRRVNAGEAQEVPAEFEVTEDEVGQYEYEVRVQPLEHEIDTANNSAITYLNVIDQQIRVLLVEGDPYWDTTFLQRSLLRNDKFNADVFFRYGNGRVRALRKEEPGAELKPPAALDDLARYDVVLLGRAVDAVLPAETIALLNRYVAERGGALVFCRGRAFASPAGAGELEPVVWGDTARPKARIEPSAEGRGLSAFRSLGLGPEELPEMFTARSVTETKPLAATLAVGARREDATPAPAIVHRRHGRGQVVSVGVEGLWRWGLNSKADGPNTPFDRFWDQFMLWMLAGRDFVPARQFSFRTSSGNILLGEKVHFRLVLRTPDPSVRAVPIVVYAGEAEVGRGTLAPSPADPGRLAAEFIPERIGRYRALARFPDGTTQESRFIVYTENLEETEVATDVTFLRRLCESSGGRLIEPGELGRLLQELGRDQADPTPKYELCPVWNEPWVFYLIGLLLGADWILRRRWGLC